MQAKIDAMAERGRLLVRSRRLPTLFSPGAGQRAVPAVELTFTDSGCGIPAADLERVFEAFFTTKVGDGKTAPQGTGLGLFMVRRLLTEDDAHIEVFSEEGVGTTFQVRLPIKAG